MNLYTKYNDNIVEKGTLLTSLSDAEIEKVIGIIYNAFHGAILYHKGTQKQRAIYTRAALYDTLGLPYTSYDVASFWANTNGEFFVNEREKMTGFVVDDVFNVLLMTTVINLDGEESTNHYYKIGGFTPKTWSCEFDLYGDQERRFHPEKVKIKALTKDCARERLYKTTKGCISNLEIYRAK